MYAFAIIGCGHIAQKHAAHIRKQGKLLAVCDTDPKRAESMAKEFDARAYTSIDDLLAAEKDVDVISICSPNGTHAEHSIKSLQAGKHVLCEQPFCLTAAGAWQTVETEKYTARSLYVVRRLQAERLKDLKNKILRKKGRILSFDLTISKKPEAREPLWKRQIFPGGGLLYTNFFPYMDFLLAVCGEVEASKGFASSMSALEGADTETNGAVSLLMKNGAVGTLHWSMNANAQKELTVVTDNDLVRLSSEDLDVIGDEGSEYGEVYKELIHAIKNNLPSTIFDGVRTVEAIEKIYKGITHTTSSSH
jgi:predicted dehydrogenase